MANDLYIGLMSGTSMDAVDAALVSISASEIKLLASHKHDLPQNLRAEILALNAPAENEINRMMALDIALGRLFSEAVQILLKQSAYNASDIRAIGSHGQTLRHDPSGKIPNTLQIADPNTIAEITGITTVADFRRRDLAVGGQGAPLVPAFHAALFQDSKINRVIVNIGGIANITVLPNSDTKPVTGFDTGPGNLLMDAWIQKHQNVAMDKYGNWAADGKVNNGLLSTLLADKYFKLPPPKSSGRDYFHLAWLEHTLKEFAHVTPVDVQASLCELTARTIADAINNQALQFEEILICGGGAHNLTLLKLLKQHLPQQVNTTEVIGVSPDWVEAMAFAWLAQQTVSHQPGNLPSVTGARKAVILGGMYQ